MTTTEHALLGMLARHGETSGYALLKQADESIGLFWSPARSHVYELLPRLAERGLAHRRVVLQDGKPDKHLWRLTPRGRATLRRWLNSPEPDPLGHLSVLMLKLFFGDYGAPDALVTLIERFRDQLSDRLRQLRWVEAEAMFASPQELPRLTLGIGLAEVQAHLGWAEAVLPRLRERAQDEAPRRTPSTGKSTIRSEGS